MRRQAAAPFVSEVSQGVTVWNGEIWTKKPNDESSPFTQYGGL